MTRKDAIQDLKALQLAMRYHLITAGDNKTLEALDKAITSMEFLEKHEIREECCACDKQMTMITPICMNRGCRRRERR